MSHPFISSQRNHYLRHLIRLREDRHYRTEQKRVVIPGRQLITEIASQTTIHSLLIPPDSDLPPPPFSSQVSFGTDRIRQQAAGLQTPIDWIAEVSLPPPQLPSSLTRLVVLDRLADPGNLGTLCRTARALRWDGIFFVTGSVDPFNDKALRASRAALFFFPYTVGSHIDLISCINDHHLTPLIADPYGEPIDYPSIVTSSSLPSCALILGNEAHGPSSDLPQEWKKVAISIDPLADSLNVAIAGGIFLYLYKK